MGFLLIGCLSYAPFYVYDRLKIRGINHLWLFAVSFASILVCSVGCFFTGPVHLELSVFWKVLAGLLAAVNALLMIRSLFFSLPKGTYDGDISNVVDTGLYALCRHPGVLFFGGMHFFLWLVSGRDMMLLCAACFTLCDVLYVYVQDRRYFPLMLPGYEEYKKRVPFLIPTGASIVRCIESSDRKVV